MRVFALAALFLLVPIASFGQCTNAGIVDFSGGTAGSAATPTTLSNSGHGIPGNWNFTVSSNQASNGGITFTSASYGSLVWNHPFCSSPYAFYTDTSSVGLKYDTGSGGLEWIQFNYPTNQGTLVHATTGGWVSTNLPQTSGVNIDMGPTTQGAANGFNNVILVSNGTNLGLTCEATPQSGPACSTFVKDGNGNSVSRIPITSDFKRLWVTMEYFRSAGSGHYAGRVYQESTVIPGTVGALIGQWDFDPGAGVSAPLYTYWGDAINNTKPSGFEYRLDHFTDCFATARTCPFPLLPDSDVPLWSKLLDPSRAMNWTNAGIQGNNTGTLPSSSWTQLGSTLAAGTYAGATITANMAGCSNQFYKLGAGTFNVTGVFNIPQNCEIRGLGANVTFLVSSSAANCRTGISALVCIKNSGDNTFIGNTPTVRCNWTAGYAQGATQITLSGCIQQPGNVSIPVSGTGIVPGTLLALTQCGTGFSGPGDCTGAAVDNGNFFEVFDKWDGTNGATANGGGSFERPSTEIPVVTAINTGTGIVTIYPPLIFPIWSGSRTPTAQVIQPISNVGVKDLSIDLSGSTAAQVGVEVFNAYHFWVHGLRVLNNKYASINIFQSSQGLVQSNYVYGTTATLPNGYGIRPYYTEGVLIANNISQNICSPFFSDAPSAGNVYAYNFAAGDQTNQSFMCESFTEHWSNYYTLFEGNIGNQINPDDNHGAAMMNTSYRNFMTGWNSFPANAKASNLAASANNAFTRYHNIVANVFGTPGVSNTYNVNSGNFTIYWLGAGIGGVSPPVPVDPLTKSTTLLFANFDTVSNANRFCGGTGNTGWSTTCGSASEVPLTASIFPNPIPAKGDAGQAALPASLIFTSRPDWYASSKPFPGIGPDITGGNISQCNGTINTPGLFAKVPATNPTQCAGQGSSAAWAGHVNSNPAMDCYLSMGGPVDGSGSALNFDPLACYSASSIPPGTISGPGKISATGSIKVNP